MVLRLFFTPLERGRSYRFLLLLCMCLFTLIACQQQQAEQSSEIEQQDLTKHPNYSKYDFGHDETVIDIGVQPMWVPANIIIETMKHDATLQEELKTLGMSVRFHPFSKGSDINFFLQRGDLDAGVGGDMPALMAAANGDILIASMIQQGFVSVVAKRSMLMSDLKEKRIAYTPGSNAHFALMNALHAINVDQSSVEMIPMDVHEMPRAMKRGDVDVLSAWEPVPSIAKVTLGAVDVFRSLTTGYFYFSNDYANRHPKSVRQIIASQIRSMKWLNSDSMNLLMASGWVKESWQAYAGAELPLSDQQLSSLASDDILQLATVPVTPKKRLKNGGMLHEEFEFLKALGEIEAAKQWDRVLLSFDNKIINDVMAGRSKYTVNQYQLLHADKVEEVE